ncbi:MbnP family copper-binding protein [Arsukibacterium indicum]|uniref:Metallo-mystery pair system four-Cys motif protein n=1 Tax=Arsukibacterium indicum TaxID=2848612 RepID=A0ABS6MKS0_9GAMM|nr:MbnP family copper-binding protein [Arsukibacterium indicum]MBV2129411.1 metallo-mystery pair system four-Cys motif protein [Arsukibacterium indicum]
MNVVPALIATIGLLSAVSLLSSCQPEGKSPRTNLLPVKLSWQQQAISCHHSFELENQQWQIRNLKFYLSDFSLDQHPLSLVASTWQQSQLVLLGTNCQGNSNWQVHFQQPLISGQLSFTLGLPFAINHQNPLTATTPLNHGDMFWSWQLGYKFLRLDMQSQLQGWAFHLGSTGCQSASVLRPPLTPCNAANTYRITLRYQPGQHLHLDLAQLLNQLVPTVDNSCMSDNLLASCQLLFNNLAQRQIWQMVSTND